MKDSTFDLLVKAIIVVMGFPMCVMAFQVIASIPLSFVAAFFEEGGTARIVLKGLGFLVAAACAIKVCAAVWPRPRAAGASDRPAV